MLIYNVTYHASAAVYDNFVKWLCCEFVPRVKSGGMLHSPQLTRVMDGNTGADGYSYALQFHVASVDVLKRWIETEGAKLSDEMTRCFGPDVVGFSTLLEKIDID